MRMRILVAALLIAALLSGCSGSSETTETLMTGPAELAPDKGGIVGLLIDDIYRPIPGGLIFVEGVGLTATTDALGQFSFTDMAPGTYVLLVNAASHEGSPINVDVSAGEYTEVELSARRIFSSDGAILTQQYSVFIACSAEVVVRAVTGLPCNGDLSGDSTRTGFETDLSAEADNITYMITEVKFNQKGSYSVVIGLMDDTNTYDIYYSEADVLESNYIKITNKNGAINEGEMQNVGLRNTNFTFDPPFTTTIFPHGTGYGQVCPPETPATNPVCLWGAGAPIAVKANIVQSVFIGEPDVDLEAYNVLKPAE